MGRRFEYLRPETVQEACELKARYGLGSRCIAGGTDLLLQWRNGEVDFGYCIDLTFVSGLGHYEKTSDGMHIGALTTLSALENGIGTDTRMPCIANAAKQMCTPQIRNFATVGGNVCNASPAADLPVLFVALGASAKLLGTAGERNIPLEDLFKGVNETCLEEDEILAEIRIPLARHRTAPSFRRAGRSVVDVAQVSVAASIGIDTSGVIADAKIALGAVAPTPIRSRTAEEALLGCELAGVNEQLIEKVSGLAASDARPISDLRGSSEYRRYMVGVLVKRSIEACVSELGGRP
jgi:carbon-monoxide dehydrogenase medium subunit